MSFPYFLGDKQRTKEDNMGIPALVRIGIALATGAFSCASKPIDEGEYKNVGKLVELRTRQDLAEHGLTLEELKTMDSWEAFVDRVYPGLDPAKKNIYVNGLKALNGEDSPKECVYGWVRKNILEIASNRYFDLSDNNVISLKFRLPAGVKEVTAVKPAVDKPQITLITPNSGERDTKITITGSSLRTKDECEVFIGGKKAEIKEWTSQSIKATVPGLKISKTTPVPVKIKCFTSSNEMPFSYEVVTPPPKVEPTPPPRVEPTPPPKVEPTPALKPSADLCKTLGFSVPSEKVESANNECGAKTLATEKNECCQQYELGIK